MFEAASYRFWSTDSERWGVADPVVYLSRSGDRHVVPAGFGSDGASFYRLLWPVLPPFGKYFLPSVVHDWYCENPQLMERREADLLFREMLFSKGVAPWLARTMYAGVRVGAAFNKLKEMINGN